ncbi:hypothetical protein CN679_24930 [Bacillus pseudomycoides]|uniref:transposase n=1 Tax=Bacillus pseudomycoides TaxID=64104 RepID=UPI000BF1BC89|nr:hypothetical protein CN679_24930 [Bacillus pseudomycoides]
MVIINISTITRCVCIARGNGKRYDETFKIEVVKYIRENHKPVAQVAREMSVNENTLPGWIKKYGQQPEIKAIQSFSSTLFTCIFSIQVKYRFNAIFH